MLNGKQARFLTALLSAPSVSAAARECGVSQRAASRWMADPGFRKALRTARRQVVEQAVSLAAARFGEAVSTLTALMREGPPGIRTWAAQQLIATALRGLGALDHDERLAEIEARLGIGDEQPVKHLRSVS